GNEIQRVRSLFKFGFDAGHMAAPVRFGPGFKKPSKKVLRLHRASQGPRMFERGEIKKVGSTTRGRKRASRAAASCGLRPWRRSAKYWRNGRHRKTRCTVGLFSLRRAVALGKRRWGTRQSARHSAG